MSALVLVKMNLISLVLSLAVAPRHGLTCEGRPHIRIRGRTANKCSTMEELQTLP